MNRIECVKCKHLVVSNYRRYSFLGGLFSLGKILGMFQRLEKLKKHAFASVCLFGADNNSSISGVWIWRGQKLAFEQSPDWQVDYDVYGKLLHSPIAVLTHSH